MLLAALRCLFLASFAAQVALADWPEFRGPRRDGVSDETKLLQTWPEGGPPRLWTTNNRGLGFGTPTVADGKIFGMGTRDGQDGVWSLRESDGSELWFAPFDDARNVDQNKGPSGSPTYSDGKLYAVSSNGKLVCLDAATGAKQWGVDYVADYGSAVPNWGFTDSPLVDGPHVIAAPASAGAAIVALDKQTGREIWKTPLDRGPGNGVGYSSPIKATLGGVPQYLLLTGETAGMIGVRADDGALLWQYQGKAATGGVAQIPLPIVDEDRVLVSCSYNGGAALLRIVREGSEFHVNEIKTHRKRELNNHHGGMVPVGGYAYLGHNQNDGNPACVDLKTGEIQWGPEPNPAGGEGSASVLYADGRLYFCYQNGVLALVEPSPQALEVISSFKLPDPSGKEHWTHPVIAHGKLYLRDQDKLHCFDVIAK